MSLEKTCLPKYLYETGCMTEKVDLDLDRWVNSYNPFDGELVGKTPKIHSGQIPIITRAAKGAFEYWKALSAKERSVFLRAFYEKVIQNKEALAHLVTLEQGKPLCEAVAEVEYAASYIEWYAEEAKRAYGEIIPSPDSSSRVLVAQMPVGVCVAITPWNFPLAMITRKLAPALAAGCSIIIKPAPQTPLCAVALANIWLEVCDVDGLVQVVCGEAEQLGKTLLESSIVRKLTFTGSTAVGKTLYKQAANTIKRVSLELGGNAPFIVLNDSDLEKAIGGALKAKYRNAGQTCVCVNRFIVEEEVYDEFKSLLISRSSQLTCGAGITNPSIGPLIDDSARRKVLDLIESAVSEGGNLVLAPVLKGNLMSAAVIEVSADSAIANTEVFGPISILIKAENEAQAIDIANNVDVGLAGYVYGENLAKTMRVAELLEVGMVGVNTGVISNASAPFGGVKESGLGREGGWQGLKEYLDEKYFCVGGF